mmetsp:Transcript_2437/g.5148  ORF Transcript_2437/g.5148 Transcript_2437/m.5148 type:complete len:226 (+) Transcript_2437:401-1078(+)
MAPDSPIQSQLASETNGCSSTAAAAVAAVTADVVERNCTSCTRRASSTTAVATAPHPVVPTTITQSPFFSSLSIIAKSHMPQHPQTVKHASWIFCLMLTFIVTSLSTRKTTLRRMTRGMLDRTSAIHHFRMINRQIKFELSAVSSHFSRLCSKTHFVARNVMKRIDAIVARPPLKSVSTRNPCSSACGSCPIPRRIFKATRKKNSSNAARAICVIAMPAFPLLHS